MPLPKNNWLLIPGLLIWIAACVVAAFRLGIDAAQVIAMAGFVLNFPLALRVAYQLWRAGRRERAVMWLFMFSVLCMVLSTVFFLSVPQALLWIETAMGVSGGLCVFTCFLIFLSKLPRV